MTGDRNLIMVSAIVQYRIDNARDYLFAVVDVPKLIESVASSALSNAIARMEVDDVFTVQRVAVQNEVLRATQAALVRHRVGAVATSVSLEGVAPPAEVADAFRDVTAPGRTAKGAIHKAEAYASGQAELTKGDVESDSARGRRVCQRDDDKSPGRCRSFHQDAFPAFFRGEGLDRAAADPGNDGRSAAADEEGGGGPSRSRMAWTWD